MNATKTIIQEKPHITYKSATVLATRMLANKGFQKAIVEVLEDAGLTQEKVAEVHRRNAIQEENLTASNTAIDMYYKIKGDFAPQQKETINLNLTGDELKEYKENLLKELKELANA